MNYVRFVVLIMLVCFSTLVIAAPIKLELEVFTPVGGDPTLRVKAGSNTSKCPGGPDDCIEVGKGKTPYIIFKLLNACDGNAGDPEYKLVNFRITLIEKLWPTPVNPLNSMAATDFNANPDTGEIGFSHGNNVKTKKKMKFKNHNSHRYSVFYEIMAEHCDASSDADDIHLDPEIRNKG